MSKEKGAKKKIGFFTKVTSREDALDLIKGCAGAFAVLALIQCAVGYFGGLAMVIDGVVYLFLAGILYKWKSRTAAITLLLVSTVAVANTFMNRMGVSEGGSNIFLVAIIFWASIRSVEASFKLHGRFRQEISQLESQARPTIQGEG